MKVYFDESNVVDRSILEEDKLTFAMLYRVLGGPVKKVITDHSRLSY